MNARVWMTWVGGLLLILLAAEGAQAHRVNVFAWVEGDSVRVESKYPDGTRVKAGVIRVLDEKGVELLAGETNDRGEFAFKAPAAEALTIVLEAGMGHRADWTLTREDLAGAAAGDRPPPPAQAAAGSAPSPPAAAPEAAFPTEAALERALDRKLAPVMKMLAEMSAPRVRASDVLGGIGWIMGLVGIAAYFKRKPR